MKCKHAQSSSPPFLSKRRNPTPITNNLYIHQQYKKPLEKTKQNKQQISQMKTRLVVVVCLDHAPPPPPHPTIWRDGRWVWFFDALAAS
ncbi:unnamed protein product [Periconia digitata]|uniref:Uncharacterized protein n=1 Tax=Periconia digitata TaxID=1303443 RepID=A0A9W4UGT6_9PLEO|nr:unnamed protein product [Periconia digitata]